MIKLRRVIGLKAMILLCINSIIGTGIFFLPSIGAQYAGPASLISWILIGIFAIFMSFIFAELVSMYPKAGGVFEYSKQAFGEFPSFMTGWISWLVANVTISMLIVGALYYLLPGSHFVVKIFLSLIILIFFNFVSYIGMNISKIILLLFSVLTISIPIILIVFGIPKVDISNFNPFFVYPVSTILLAMFFISETFIGWESITFLSEEAKNPKKIMPKSIIIATSFIVLISILLVFVSMGIVNWEIFCKCSVPFLMVSEILFGKIGGAVVSLLIFFIIIGSAAAWIISTPRLLLAMSREKLFLKGCHLVHKKYNTPYIAILFQTIVSFFMILMGLGNYKLLLSFLLPLIIIMYMLVLISFINLRKNVKMKRPFKSIFGIKSTYMIILFNISLLIIWFLKEPGSLITFLVCVGLIFLGIPIYIMIKLQDKKFVEFFFDHISGLYNLFLPFWYGENERKTVIKNADIKRGYRVLDYGCGGGPNLIELSEEVGDGYILGIDISKKQLERSVREVRKCSKKNVILIKEDDGGRKFEKNTFDAIISIGVISHQSNPKKLLLELKRILKPKRKISILEFGKSFLISPPIYLKNKRSIYNLFKKTGFKNIKIREKKKLFTKYYFITAEG